LEDALPTSIQLQAELQAAITQETEWRGNFLRKIREARRVSIEEMADSTKISRSYLVAIEEENFSRLPAPVYLRGFLLQYARYLRLPQEAAASAYLARYHQAKGRAQ
jgi:cytoskeletal protein RodZ